VSQKNTHSLKKKPTILNEISKNWVAKRIQKRLLKHNKSEKILIYPVTKFYHSYKN